MHKTIKFFLTLNGIILLSYAVVFLIHPAKLGQIIGFTHHSPNTLVEIMAFYGGLELGLAIYFIRSGFKTERFKPALTVFVFAFLSAGLARLIGVIHYGFDDLSQPIVAGVEISFSLFAFWLRKKLPAV